MSNPNAVRPTQSGAIMGQERVVTFVGGAVPPWQRVGELLTRSGFPVQMRMIDGQLAFPDEQPPESWSELRVGTSHGMVTVRREADRVRLVTWGNADAAMVQAWNALAWAFAEAGGGLVDGQSPADFRRHAELPSPLRGL
jgi:hypothetical protein